MYCVPVHSVPADDEHYRKPFSEIEITCGTPCPYSAAGPQQRRLRSVVASGQVGELALIIDSLPAMCSKSCVCGSDQGRGGFIGENETTA